MSVVVLPLRWRPVVLSRSFDRLRKTNIYFYFIIKWNLILQSFDDEAIDLSIYREFSGKTPISLVGAMRRLNVDALQKTQT